MCAFGVLSERERDLVWVAVLEGGAAGCDGGAAERMRGELEPVLGGGPALTGTTRRD